MVLLSVSIKCKAPENHEELRPESDSALPARPLEALQMGKEQGTE